MAQVAHNKIFSTRTFLAGLTALATLGTLSVATIADAAPATIADSAQVAPASNQPALARATRGAATAPKPLPTPAPEAAPAIEAPSVSVVPARVRVPSVGLDLQIFRGGQSTIDRGVATLFDDGPGGFPAPINAGDNGTLWLTGHRTQAGGPFGPVMNINVGDIVDIIGTNGELVQYRISSRTVVNASDHITSFFAVFGTNPSIKALTLQTSLPNNHRMIVRGEII